MSNSLYQTYKKNQISTTWRTVTIHHEPTKPEKNILGYFSFYLSDYVSEKCEIPLINTEHSFDQAMDLTGLIDNRISKSPFKLY